MTDLACTSGPSAQLISPGSVVSMYSPRLMKRTSTSLVSASLFASAPACLLGLVHPAHAQNGRARQEIAESLENTSARIDVVREDFAQLGERWLDFLPLLTLALVTVALFWALAHLLTKSDFLFRWIDNRFLRDMVRHLTRIAMIALGLLIALELLDATALVGAALGAAGVVGIAVGFAFRDIIENYLAGLLLSMRHPFEPNDFVSVDGNEGKVVRLTSRATVLLTLDGNHLRIPNAKVFKAVLVNYTQNPLRRIDFVVDIGVSEDLATAQQLGAQALTAMDAIMDEPPPLALIERLGDSSVSIHFYAWVDQRRTDFFKAQSEAIRIVKSTFDKAGIDMPAPIYQVHLSREIEAPARMAPPPTKSLEPGDTASDVRLDEQVESERAAQGPDLLDEEAPRE
jgi:small-conductance mechanosensitive channel